MNQGQTVFSRLMDFVPMYEFRKCVKRYRGHHKVQRFSCWNQFLCMAFARLTYRESLRDIESCLNAMPNKLYHMGFRGKVCRSTLAYANKTRDWRIYADCAHQVLIRTARGLYQNEAFGVELANTVYALDSTTIDLCLSLFPWAHFRKTKGAIKLHTLLDLRGNIPSCIEITAGKVHDVNILDRLVPEPGSFYILDRGYLDFARLYRLMPYGYIGGAARRSDDSVEWLLRGERLLGQAAPHSLLRCADKQRVDVSVCPLPSGTSAAGRWSCSFAGSSNTCASKRFMAPPRMR